MKRFFSALFCFIMLLPLLCVAAKAEESYFNVYPYLFHANRVESFEKLHDNGSTSYDDANLRNLGVMIEFDSKNVDSTYVVSMSFSMSSIGWATNPIIDLSSVRPYKIYFNYQNKDTYSSVHTFDYVGNVYQFTSMSTLDFYYRRNYTNADGSKVNNFINHSIDLIVSPGIQTNNIYIEFTSDVNLSAINYSTYGPDVIKIDTSAEDLKNALGSLNSTTSQGFKDLADSVSSSSEQSTKALEDALRRIEDITQLIDRDLWNFEQNIEEHTENALQEFKDKLEKEALDKMNKAVESLEKELDIDVSTLTESVQKLYDSITTDATDAVLTIPAGVVTVNGETYQFWDAAEVNFEEYFQYEPIKILLIAFRFVLLLGFGYYLFNWVKKIENLVTMDKVD